MSRIRVAPTDGKSIPALASASAIAPMRDGEEGERAGDPPLVKCKFAAINSINPPLAYIPDSVVFAQPTCIAVRILRREGTTGGGVHAEGDPRISLVAPISLQQRLSKSATTAAALLDASNYRSLFFFFFFDGDSSEN